MKSFKFLTLLSLLLSLLLSSAAWSAAPEDVLRSALKDRRAVKYDEAVELATDAKSWNPLQKADIKVSRGELQQSDLKYAFRLYPKGLGEYRTGSRFQEAMERTEKTARAEGVSLLLASRYQLLARIANLKEKKKIADDLSSLTTKANRALSYAANKDRAELKSYIKAKADLDRLQIKIADIQRDYLNLQMEMKSLELADIEKFEFSDWAEMSDLRSRLAALKPAPKTAPDEAATLTGQVAQTELASARSEVAYARARDEKWLDHIELSMKEDQKEKVYGVEVSFNLPFLSAPDLSTIEKEARVRREEAKALDAAELSAREYQNGLTELQTLLDLHRSLVDSQSKLNPEQMRKASAKIAAQDPLLAVELQRSWYEGRDQILELELRIRTLFILFLHESSEIARAPDVNHLSKSLKRIM